MHDKVIFERDMFIIIHYKRDKKYLSGWFSVPLVSFNIKLYFWLTKTQLSKQLIFPQLMAVNYSYLHCMHSCAKNDTLLELLMINPPLFIG